MLEGGAQDILVEPVNDAELVIRVQAAGRTKGLQEQIVAQAARLEALLFEDPLTGLANRRFILTQLGGMISGARRHHRPLTAAVIDSTTSRPSTTCAATRRATGCRPPSHAPCASTCAPGTSWAGSAARSSSHCCPTPAPATLEKLRASVEEVGVTVSSGWAAWEGESGDELLQRADDALYEAKARGRDCVVAAPATLPRRR